MDRFVVEANRSVVGVAVRGAGGFRFFTSNPRFKSLEGKTFRRVRALRRRVEELAGRSLPSGEAPRLSVQ